MGSETRTVGARGQVTIPKELREQLGIHGGDEVVVREEEGKIVIEASVLEDRLAEGYRRRAETARDLEVEMAGVLREADGSLGDVPEW